MKRANVAIRGQKKESIIPALETCDMQIKCNLTSGAWLSSCVCVYFYKNKKKKPPSAKRFCEGMHARINIGTVDNVVKLGRRCTRFIIVVAHSARFSFLVLEIFSCSKLIKGWRKIRCLLISGTRGDKVTLATSSARLELIIA